MEINEEVLVTRTPENLLSYKSAIVVEVLKTRYRVLAENNFSITFMNGRNNNDYWYVFKKNNDLILEIENYKEKENDLLLLIENSEKIQYALAEKMALILRIDGHSNIDLNSPETNGSDFHLTT